MPFPARKSLCFTSAVKKTADGNEEIFFVPFCFFIFLHLKYYPIYNPSVLDVRVSTMSPLIAT